MMNLSSSRRTIPEYRETRNLYFLGGILIPCEDLSLCNALVNFIKPLKKDYDIVSAHFWIAKQNRKKFALKTFYYYNFRRFVGEIQLVAYLQHINAL